VRGLPQRSFLLMIFYLGGRFINVRAFWLSDVLKRHVGVRPPEFVPYTYVDADAAMTAALKSGKESSPGKEEAKPSLGTVLSKGFLSRAITAEPRGM